MFEDPTVNRVAPSGYQTICKNDLSYQLRPLLVFGRLIGAIPLSGVTTGTIEKLKFRLWSPSSIWNLTCCIFMVINSVLGAVGFVKSNERLALGMAKNIIYCVLYLVSVFIYLILLLKAKDFIQCLKDWKSVKLHFATEDKSLWRDINLAVGLIYTSIILENISWHIKHALKTIEIADTNGTTSALIEGFFIRAWPMPYSVIGCHPIYFGIIFITNKLTLYVREFGDALLIVTSRAIYYKFKLLIQEVERKLVANGKPEGNIGQGYIFDKAIFDTKDLWTHLIEDFNTLLNMLSSFEQFLSPLIFISFSINAYYLSMRLCFSLQLQESLTLIDSLYANWAYLHGIIRCYLVALSASKINEHASSVQNLLHKCPQECYTFEVKRLQYILHHSEIGLTGFGCFTITKPFMLKFLGVIFTVVIFLFQA